METDLSGNTLRWYYFFNGQRVARQLTTNEVGFYMTDHLGSVRYLGGSATGYSIDYYPFGGIIVNADTGDDRYQFTGKERDSESNLDNFGARFDSSQWGRFMSPDPQNAGASADDPQSWNAYSYADNDPLGEVDPDGRDPQDPNDPCAKDPDHCTQVKADPPPALSTTMYSWRVTWQELGKAAQRANDYLHALYQAALANSRAACVAATTVAGATAAGVPLAEAGGSGGATLGLAGGPFAEVTVPAGAALGSTLLGGYGAIKGGQAGYALGQAVCSTGTGSGGGSSSSGSGRGGGSKQGSFWKSLKNYRQNIKTDGERYYQWDYTHGDVEVYNSRGQHLGSADAETGQMIKPAVPGRTLDL